MKNFSALFTFILLVLFSVHSAVAETKKPKLDEVASKLSCYCGTCPHLAVSDCDCSTADQIKRDIQKMIDSGMSQEQIVASYVQQYGDTVLSAPPKKGFNLTAWALPFAAFLFGGFVLFSYLKKQKEPENKESTTPEQVADVKGPKDDYYRKLIEKELKDR